jgi:phage shock protein A
MSIFSRIFKIGQAKTNQIIDKLEKPEVMLDQAIRDKAQGIQDAKRALQTCIATERQTKAQLNQYREEKALWEGKAEAALLAGKEDLAVKALQRVEEAEAKIQSTEPNWQGQKNSLDQIKGDIHKMEDELAELKRNKDFIIAQSKTAEVKKSIYEARAKVNKRSDVDDLISRMKAKAERATFEADAAQEMATTFDGRDSLEKEFDSLGSSSANPNVQDKLAALKSKLGQS